MRHGLPQDSVTDILQADDGYLWVTTFGGIARFDGLEFTALTPANTEGLNDTRFVSLAQSGDGALWFAAEEGGVYRLFDGEMALVDARRVLHLRSDGAGGVWGAAISHFVRFGGDDPEIVPVPDGTAHYLARLPSGGLLGSGRRMAPRCLHGPCGALPAPPRWDGADYQRWSQDDSGAFWVSSHDRVMRFVDGAWQIVRDDEGIAIQTGFALDWQQHTWHVHDGQIFDPTGDAAVATPDFEAPIRTILRDEQGTLWIGLDGGGLVHLVPQPSHLHGPPGRGVHTVARRGEGVWAAGCAGIVAADTAPPTGWGDWELFRCPRVWSDGAGRVLLYGARRADVPLAVLRYDDSGTPELVASLSPENPDRFAAAVEGPWFVFEDQLYVVPPTGRAEPVLAAGDLRATDLLVLEGDASGPVLERAVWLLLDNVRLVQWRAGEVLRDIALDDDAPARDVLVRGDRTWISTYGAGLLAVRGDRIEARLTTARGLCDDALSHLYDPGDGRLWFNTNRGVGYVEEAALEAVVAGERPRVQCVRATDLEANGRYGVLGADGRIWAPTTEGLSEVDPAGVSEPAPPPLRLSLARYRGHDLRTGSRVRGPGVLELEFVALDFVHPREVQYRYGLEGPTSTGTGWSAPTRSRQLHLGPLAPGDYTFRVQALAPGAPWTEPVTLSFVRQPWLGETAGVRIGLPLGLGSTIVLGLVGAWVRDRRAKEALQTEIAERERAEARALREQRERTRAQAELEASRRLQSVGRLAGGVAHDFNNLLTVVASHAMLLADHDDDEVRESADELTSLVDRATQLVRQLLVVGQQGPHAPVLLEIGDAVEELLPLLQRMIRASVVLGLTREARCWVRIDPARLDQVVTNLVLNASEAIEGDGRIGLSVGVTDGPDGPRAELGVADTGPGMSPEQIARAFEPYYSTKTAEQGTGLGLATVHGAVKEAGGEVTIDSPPAGGTQVSVRLPLERSEPFTPRVVREAPPPARAQAAGGALRLLIVDDREYLARSVARMVRSLGWTASTATGLSEAVDHALRDRFDVLLSDVVMPGADGPAVFAAVSAVQPGLPVLFMTGYADGVLGDALRDEVVLRKPFSVEQLQQALDIVLTRAAATRASSS